MHVLYAKILNLLWDRQRPLYISNRGFSIFENIEILQAIYKRLSEDLEKVNLSILKFEIVDYIFEDLLKFSDFELLDASPFELLKFAFKTFVRMTFMRKDTCMGEVVKAMSVPVESETWKDRKILKRQQERLAMDSFHISLAVVKYC